MKFNTLCCLIASIAFLAETVYLVSTIVATILQFIRWIAERLETLKHSLERFSVSEYACNTNSELTLHDDNPMMWSATSPPGEVCTTTKYLDSEVFTSIQATPAPLGAIAPAEDTASLDVLPSLGGFQPLMLPEVSPLGDADAAIEEAPLGVTSPPGGFQPLMLPASLPLGTIAPAEDIASLDALPPLGGSQPLMLPECSPLDEVTETAKYFPISESTSQAKAKTAFLEKIKLAKREVFVELLQSSNRNEESPLGDTSPPGGSQPLMLPASLPLGTIAPADNSPIREIAPATDSPLGESRRAVKKASPLGQAFLSKAYRNQAYLQSLRVAGLQQLIKKEKKIAKFGTFPKVPTKANKATLVAALLTYYNSLA